MNTLPLALLRKRRRRVSDCIFDWKTLIVPFLKWLSYRLFVHWIFCLVIISSSFGIFSWTIILQGCRQKPIIRTRWIQYFSNICPLIVLSLGLWLLGIAIHSPLWFWVIDVKIKEMLENILPLLWLHLWVPSIPLAFLFNGLNIHWSCIINAMSI